MEDNHKNWDKYLSEFRFTLNSAGQETTGVSPAKLQLGMKLKSPMDKLLQRDAPAPDPSPYNVVHQLKLPYSRAKESAEKAQKHQLRNYNKMRREKPKDRVCIRHFLNPRPRTTSQQN